MQVLQETNDKRGSFYIEENGKRVGTIEYVFAGGDKFIIEHTEVDESQEGKGLGKILVQATIDYAREHNYKIIPLCPYAHAFFKKRMDEFGDLLWKL